jgi:hypothetical protein
MRQSDKIKMQIIELQYFGCVELYSTLISCKHIYFYPESPYQKAHHPNRMWLAGANGLISLSIPLLGGRNQKGIFRDIQIAEDGNWRRIHWRSIHDSYRKSPWFEELGWQIESFYQTPEKFLVDWNIKSMMLVQRLLKLKLDILAQTDASNEQAEVLKIGSNPLTSPPISYPGYQQVFMERSGFIANLGILDLLFCKGPDAKNYLESLAAHKSIG